MPRPVEESRVRRFMMQTIMWVILGLTVGAAALVDRVKQRRLQVVLGPSVKLDEFSVRLPQGWEEIEEMEGGPNRIVRQDPDFRDVLLITSRTKSLRELFSMGEDVTDEKIPMGDQTVPLIVSRDLKEQQMSVRATRTLPSGRLLTITLLTEEMDRRHLQHEKDLIKQIAASVKVEEAK